MVRVHHVGPMTAESVRLWFDCSTGAPDWFEIDGKRHWIAEQPDVSRVIEALSSFAEPPSLRGLAEHLGESRKRMTNHLKAAGVEDAAAWIAEQWNKAQPAKATPKAARCTVETYAEWREQVLPPLVERIVQKTFKGALFDDAAWAD